MVPAKLKMRFLGQEAMATAQKAGAGGTEEPIMPPIMEPSAEDPGVKKSKKRKVAEAQAVQAQAAEASADADATPAGGLCLAFRPFPVSTNLSAMAQSARLPRPRLCKHRLRRQT